MSYENITSMIEHLGYTALFFSLWLGIIGMPIPDEVIVMTGGAVTANHLLHPVPAFILTYLGVVSGLSLGYILGRYVGVPIMERIKRKKKMEKYIHISERLVQKYGSFALCISYFFPIVRHVMPYLVGINKMSFGRYALFSYTTGLVWTLLFFILGRFVGEHVQQIGYFIYNSSLKVLLIPVVLIIVFIMIRLFYSYKKSQRRDPI